MAGRGISRCSKLPDLQSVGLHQGRTEEVQVASGVQALPGWLDTTDPSQSDRRTASISCKGIIYFFISVSQLLTGKMSRTCYLRMVGHLSC